jgi:predicted nucleotidyltransferase
MKISYFSPDIQDFIRLLAKYEVRYVIIGGVAVIYYGSARLTGDIDFLYESSANNAKKLFSALYEFWRGSIPGLKKEEELIGKNIVVQFGVIPNRIDLLTSIEAVEFKDAWKNRLEEKITIDNKEYPIYFISLEQLIKNKESVNRDKDKQDLKFLDKVRNRKNG